MASSNIAIDPLIKCLDLRRGFQKTEVREKLKRVIELISKKELHVLKELLCGLDLGQELDAVIRRIVQSLVGFAEDLIDNMLAHVEDEEKRKKLNELARDLRTLRAVVSNQTMLLDILRASQDQNYLRSLAKKIPEIVQYKLSYKVIEELSKLKTLISIN